MIRKIISVTGFIIAAISSMFLFFYCFAQALDVISMEEYFEHCYPLTNIMFIGMAMTFAWRWWK